MQIDLSGQVAVVTGSSRGIGRACAEALAQSGAAVVVNYHTHADDGAAVVESIQAGGGRAVAVGADVCTRDGCQALVDAATGEFGRLDVVVANAYRSIRKPALELTPEDVAATWDATLWHSFHISQLGARAMRDQGEGGRIVFISSVHARDAYPRSLAYNVGKIGQHHIARTLATELAGDRILVNSIEPGWIDTPGERVYYSEEQIREVGRSLPLGRLGRADEIAAMVVFLCSDKADYITGSVIRIDGGYVLPRSPVA